MRITAHQSACRVDARRKAPCALAVVCACLATLSANGQVGADACSAAPLISTGTYSGSTVGATPDGVGSCEGVNPGASPDVWYRFQPPCNGVLSLDTCGSGYDTLVSVHTGCPGNTSNTVACNDDCNGIPSCESLSSCLTANVLAGSIYRIRVGGFSNRSGSYVLHVGFAPSGSAPGNDNCANAQLTIGGTYAFCTNGATTDGPNNVACDFFGDSQVGSDIWYLYYPLCTGTATVNLCGSLYDTKVAAYAGDSCDFSQLLACIDDFCGVQSEITFPVTLLEPVLIRVGGYNGAQGVGTMTISCVSATPPNDLPASPTIVGDLPYGGFVDTSAASASGFGSNCGPFGADVFYTFFPPASCLYRIETCGSSYDTAIHLYQRNGTGYFLLNCDLDGGDHVACEATASRIDAFLDHDEEYLIRFGRQGLGSGGYLGFLIDVPAPNDVLLVDSAAIGGATGRTWFNAIPNLNDALAIAQLDSSINEIWIAAGVYVPEDPNFDNSGTFRLRSNLAIYGGFAGYECDKSQRDPMANPTYLSGDPNDDLSDGPAAAFQARKHVITATGLSNVTLDGLVIRRGNDADAEQGSAIYAPGASLSVIDCRFEYDAGLTSFNESTSAIYANGGASLALARCAFRACDTPVRVEQATLTMAGCAFQDGDFGTISLLDTNATISNSTFLRNLGPFRPAVMWCQGTCDVQMLNCTAMSNATALSPAAIVLSDTSQLLVRNSLFWENTGGLSGGDAIFAQDDTSFTVEYSIVQGGEAQTFATDNAQGSWAISNLDVDPLVTPDGHLQSGSPARDAGTLDFFVFAQPDRDGEVRVTTLLDIGSDEFFDADSDGLPDYWELRYYGAPVAAPRRGDDDSDTLENIDEFARYGTNPNGQVIYVCVDGDDSHSGATPTCPTTRGTNGPKRTISAAIAAADEGASVVLLPGVFGAAGNTDLVFDKTIAIVGRDGAGATSVDCAGMTPHRFIADGRGAIVGLTITGALADEGIPNDIGGAILVPARRLAIDACDIFGNRADGGGGIGLNAANALIRDTRLLGNVADQPGLGSELLLINSTLRVDGELTVSGAGDAVVIGQVSGAGAIKVEPGATLTFGAAGLDPNSPFFRRSTLEAG
ncbi:MAG: right-handed parallel beta-helix repeat-containing protein, partial [Phycisphaerales bacterium]|nr:right-handed parallel beta-helix repeat-containing protein [Phycisphaerales bacterium]